MAVVRPFRCIRPQPGLAEKTAALPYDVYQEEEARRAVEGKPLSFLNIDRPETQFPKGTDPYAPQVYQKGKELLEERLEEGVYEEDPVEAYYIYELTMEGRSQTGIVGCASIDDYQNGIIKKHENTREDKEQDRIRHVDILGAQTGPIFLAYRSVPEICKIVEFWKGTEPLYDFTADDGVTHRVWEINDLAMVTELEKLFGKVPSVYIADGHHRAASAVKVGLKRRKEHPGYTGTEPFNYFLSVLFPGDQLMIMPYNRVVKDLNGMEPNEFLEKIAQSFQVEKVGERGKTPCQPDKKGTFGMLLGDSWYLLSTKQEVLARTASDPVASLDVSVLQDFLLGPILGIQDPRTDHRIDFVGGIRGVKELEKRTEEDMELAFSMYPTSMEELFQVADAGLLMPPKSTWFEPKLRSGLFIHKI